MSQISVLILMGSDSDAPVMQGAVDVLRELDIACEMTVASAHRSPERVMRLVREAPGRGVKVYVVGAGAGVRVGVVFAGSARLAPGVRGVVLRPAPARGEGGQARRGQGAAEGARAHGGVLVGVVRRGRGL